MPLARMKEAPIQIDGEYLEKEFMNREFFSIHLGNKIEEMQLHSCFATSFNLGGAKILKNIYSNIYLTI